MVLSDVWRLQQKKKTAADRSVLINRFKLQIITSDDSDKKRLGVQRKHDGLTEKAICDRC